MSLRWDQFGWPGPRRQRRETTGLDVRAEWLRLQSERAARGLGSSEWRASARHAPRPLRLKGALFLFAAALLLVVVTGTGYRYAPAEAPSRTSPLSPETAEAVRGLERKLAALTVRKTYIVVDQANNRLYLRRGGELLHEAICSSGSGYVLKEGEGGRTWIFDSPQGEFRVRQRVDKPVWKKPDWAFVEAGEPIPKDPSERFEYGVLGEHALYLGDGYMIHGTLYERLLGRSVTHGCVRLGRDDLRTVFAASPLGTQVFIY